MGVPAKADERDIALEMLTRSGLAREGQTIIADKGYRRASFENTLNQAGITLIRPATKTEKPRPGRRFLRPFRQIIESVNNTLKTQLDLERHGGRTKASTHTATSSSAPSSRPDGQVVQGTAARGFLASEPSEVREGVGVVALDPWCGYLGPARQLLPEATLTVDAVPHDPVGEPGPARFLIAYDH